MKFKINSVIFLCASLSLFFGSFLVIFIHCFIKGKNSGSLSPTTCLLFSHFVFFPCLLIERRNLARITSRDLKEVRILVPSLTNSFPFKRDGLLFVCKMGMDHDA